MVNNSNTSYRYSELICLEELGKGGFGSVHHAYHKRTKENLAMKSPRVEGLDSFAQKSVFSSIKREFARAKDLRHPNLIRFIDLVEDDHGHPHLLLELLTGPSLKIKSGRTFPQIYSHVSQLVSVLRYLHTLNISHNDIKLANIKFNSEGQLKLLDMGIAANLNHMVKPEERCGGTLVTMAPERMSNNPFHLDALGVVGRSDVFSLSVVVYQIIFGCHPFFEDLSAQQMRARLMTGELGTLAFPWDKAPAEIPVDREQWEAVLSKGLSSNPHNRYQTVKDFWHGLRLGLSATQRHQMKATMLLKRMDCNLRSWVPGSPKRKKTTLACTLAISMLVFGGLLPRQGETAPLSVKAPAESKPIAPPEHKVTPVTGRNTTISSKPTVPVLFNYLELIKCPVLRQWIGYRFAGSDGRLDREEFEAIVKVEISAELLRKLNPNLNTDGVNYQFEGMVRSLQGLDQFPNLEHLIIDGQDLFEVDLDFPRLKTLQIRRSKLTYFDVRAPLLRVLVIEDNFGRRNAKVAPNPANWSPQLRELTLSDVDPRHLVFSHFKHLESLTLKRNKMTEIAALPESLHSLDLSGNQFSRLPHLPRDLRRLYMDRNHLVEILALPPKLEVLYANHNQIEYIESWPGSLVQVDLGHNRLMEIPKLHDGLTYLKINHNHLRELVGWPNSLSSVDASNNELSFLPAELFANTNMEVLHLGNNNFNQHLLVVLKKLGAHFKLVI